MSEFFGALIVCALLHKIKSLTYTIIILSTGAIIGRMRVRTTLGACSVHVLVGWMLVARAPVEPTKSIQCLFFLA